MNTSHAMKLTLWTVSVSPRSCGPWSIRTIPLTNTTTVVSTTAGPIRRSNSGGGPLRRYAASPP